MRRAHRGGNGALWFVLLAVALARCDGPPSDPPPAAETHPLAE